MARIAYGEKVGVQTAIESGFIPRDTVVITKGDIDSELLFYDVDGNLITVAERTRFETLTEAEQWAKTYPCAGFIFTVQNGQDWLPYIVQSDNSLKPFKGEGSSMDITDVKRIDGGTSKGV